MACFAVFNANKQIKVFPSNDKPTFKKAIDFAMASHKSGYPCTIEEFSWSDQIGQLVYDTTKPDKYSSI